jgi:pimeloyl-ACP methyl ester carboxylesterase
VTFDQPWHQADAGIPETRYAPSGDIHIAYQTLGGGPGDLVFVAGFTSHCEHQWEQPDLARSLRRMASFSRLVWFDKRGTGLSDPVPPDQLSLELRMHDMDAVLDAVGSTSAALFGASDGGPMCTLYAATYPDRVSHLVLYGTWARFFQDTDYPAGLPADTFDAIVAMATAGWGHAGVLPVLAPSGSTCSKPTTPWSAASSTGSAAVRSRRSATASSPPSTAPPARSTAPRPSPERSRGSACGSAPASTPARWSCSTATSAASPSTSPPGSTRWPLPARCWSPAPSRTWSPGPASASSTAAPTPSKASPNPGSCSPPPSRQRRHRDQAGPASATAGDARRTGRRGGLRCPPRLARAQPQKAVAAAVRASAQATVAARLTHSTSAWAPSPAGPNRTVGIPAADRNAESAQ